MVKQSCVDCAACFSLSLWAVFCTLRETLKTTVKEHIQSLNFGYRKAVREKSVTYINAYAVFVDPHTVEYTVKIGKKVEFPVHRKATSGFHHVCSTC